MAIARGNLAPREKREVVARRTRNCRRVAYNGRGSPSRRQRMINVVALFKNKSARARTRNKCSRTKRILPRGEDKREISAIKLGFSRPAKYVCVGVSFLQHAFKLIDSTVYRSQLRACDFSEGSSYRRIVERSLDGTFVYRDLSKMYEKFYRLVVDIRRSIFRRFCCQISGCTRSKIRLKCTLEGIRRHSLSRGLIYRDNATVRKVSTPA